jgi:hypothetical protein
MKIYICLCTLIFAFASLAHFSELANGGLWHLHEADYDLSSFGLLGMAACSSWLLVRRWKTLG